MIPIQLGKVKILEYDTNEMTAIFQIQVKKFPVTECEHEETKKFISRLSNSAIQYLASEGFLPFNSQCHVKIALTTDEY